MLATALKTGLTVAVAAMIPILIFAGLHPSKPSGIGEGLLLPVLGLIVVSLVVTVIAAAGAAVRRFAPSVAISPQSSFRAHVRYLVIGRLLPGISVVAVLAIVLVGDKQFVIADLLGPMLTYGLAIGMAIALIESFGQYLVAIALLAIMRRTPWRLLRFLEDGRTFAGRRLPPVPADPTLPPSDQVAELGAEPTGWRANFNLPYR
ncbi:hypothetical protein [Actinoplanes regularis]|uniref:hypothetical protein n=1 Tax=Actinoplanes regularis TaxID=52697 RepID=UPI0024A3B1EC|nr:hypothetical protein [Actinoplanes regularis]GLW29140.1 hypothetical protein Areg01_20800 [Actinoplanes regularis]